MDLRETNVTVVEHYQKPLDQVAESLVLEAVKKSIAATEDQQLTANQQKIKGWHPHLQEQIQFRQNLYSLMIDRIKDMYAEPKEK